MAGLEVSPVGLLVEVLGLEVSPVGLEFEEPLLDEVGSLVGSWVSEVSEVSEVSLEVSEFEEPSVVSDD